MLVTCKNLVGNGAVACVAGSFLPIFGLPLTATPLISVALLLVFCPHANKATSYVG